MPDPGDRLRRYILTSAARAALITALVAGLITGLAACGGPGPSAAAPPGLVDRANGLRARNGLPPLIRVPALDRAALRHAEDMAAGGFLAHTGSDGSTLVDRVTAEGYAWCHLGENIGRGYADAGAMVTGWRDSPAHRPNLFSVTARQTGAARVGPYWVQVYAAPESGPC